MFQCADLCRSYLLEAKWFYSGYTPSFQEYIENIYMHGFQYQHQLYELVHAFFLVTNPLFKICNGPIQPFSPFQFHLLLRFFINSNGEEVESNVFYTVVKFIRIQIYP